MIGRRLRSDAPRPVEAAGTVENAPLAAPPCVFHRPLDGASGADHSSNRPDDEGQGVRKVRCTDSRQGGR